MTEGRIYLKEWRKKRGLTQEQVVNRLEMLDDSALPKTAASLSRLENGKQTYSGRVLEALAFIYDCEAWELIGRHPDRDGRVIDLVSVMNDRQRDQAITILEAILRG